MIKLTYFDGKGRRDATVWLAPAHIISVNYGNPSGAIVDTLRGTHHVAQTPEQVLEQYKNED